MGQRGSEVGKRVRSALYVHRDAVPEISAAHREAVATAISIACHAEWNVARIEPGKVALLEYEDFDKEHFPALRRSHLVDLANRETRMRDFSSSGNPPILHRKELLLSRNDRRRAKFAALSAALDERGMFVDNHKIGLRLAWARRLEEAEIVIRDHAIVPSARVETDAAYEVQVDRHKTAIPRNRLSSPMQMLARHGFFDLYPDVFDYGCGQGDDVRVLSEAGIAASGWDPHFRPDQTMREADLVNLGFVLNVIENVDERGRTLRKAWSLCRKVMSVAVMVEGHYSVEGLQPFADGYMTSRGTFQKYFSPYDFRSFVKQVLDAEPVAVAPGIVFVFREAEAEQEFLFRRRSRSSPGTSSITFAASTRPAVQPRRPLPERLRPVLEALWSKAVELGRSPEADEIAEIGRELSRSNVSVGRAMAWCRTMFDEAQFEDGAKRRRDDLVVHFALGAFSGSKAFNTLPLTLRRDVRNHFGSFAAAQSEARGFLFSLGTDSTIEEASRNAIETGLIRSSAEGQFYLDARLAEELPAALRALIGCASVLVGDAEDASLITLNLPKRSVAFYFSPNFDAPLALFTRTSTVYLRNQQVRERVLSDDARLIFLRRSEYDVDLTKRTRRSSLETKMRSVLGNREKDSLTARYGDVAYSLRHS